MNGWLRQSLAVAAASLVVAGAAAQAPCGDCGVVQSMRLVEQQGQASGVGLVAGGVVGGVLGHQIGGGRGNTVATIAGAGVGAYAGNQIEKNQKKSSYWSVAIKMDSGSVRNFTYTNKPASQRRRAGQARRRRPPAGAARELAARESTEAKTPGRCLAFCMEKPFALFWRRVVRLRFPARGPRHIGALVRWCCAGRRRDMDGCRGRRDGCGPDEHRRRGRRESLCWRRCQ